MGKNPYQILPPLIGSLLGLITLICIFAALWFTNSRQHRKNDSFVADASENPVSEVQEKYDEARRWFQKGLQATDLAEKERCYIEALKLYPSYAAAHNNLGDTYERQGRLEEALREYEIASVLAPDLPEPYFGIGDVCLKMGKFHRAVLAYEKGLLIEPKDKLTQRRLRIAKALTQTIGFEFNSSELTERAKEQLRHIAHMLQQPELKDMVFEVQGHTDSKGTAKYNLWLSERRAKAVRQFLVQRFKIADGRLVAKGYGEDRPIASNETEEGRAMNRRVQFEMLKRISQSTNR